MQSNNHTSSTKLCVCGETFQTRGKNHKYCTRECQVKHNADAINTSRIKHLIKKGVHIGVGKGGRIGKGKDNPAYKHGFGWCLSIRKETKERIRYCRDCGKDLIDATHYQWCIHHIDHNRYNNPEDGSNWTLLCKRCHQIEHKCWTALEGATTSLIRLPNGRYSNPNKRSSLVGSEVPDTLTIDVEG